MYMCNIQSWISKYCVESVPGRGPEQHIPPFPHVPLEDDHTQWWAAKHQQTLAMSWNQWKCLSHFRACWLCRTCLVMPPCGKKPVACQSGHDSTTNKHLACLETTANNWAVLVTAGIVRLVSWLLLVEISRPLTRMVTIQQPTNNWNVSKQMHLFETSWKLPDLPNLSPDASWWRQGGHSLKWS